METKLPLLVGAPFEKAGFLVGAKTIEGAANDEVAAPPAVGVDMEVLFVGPDVIVASRPKHIACGVADRALPGVIWADEDIES
jgi:hypothetical protein